MVLKTLNIESPAIESHELKGDPHHLAPLLKAVIRFAKPERIFDATAGSGITAKVAEDEAIPCTALDLHDPEAPVDLFTFDEPGAFDLVVYHPDLWCAREDAAHPHDLGATMDWDAYVDLNAEAIEHLASQLSDDGHLLAILPIARRRGKVYSLARDLQCLLGASSEPEMVHPHPECRSRGTMYGRRFIPIAHDQVVLWKKSDLADDSS